MKNKEKLNIRDRIINEKFKMIRNKRTMFYAHLFEFITINTDSKVTETACVCFSDKGSTINMEFNPSFISTLTDKQLQTLITHEIMHITNEHFNRRGKRDKFLWNIATDLAINSILKSEDFDEIKGWLIPEKYGFSKNLSAEEYYKNLKQNRNTENKNLGDIGNDNSENKEDKTIDDHSYWEKVKKTENNSKGQENKNIGLNNSDDINSQDNSSKEQENKNIDSTESFDNSNDSNKKDESTKKNNNSKEYRKINKTDISNIRTKINEAIEIAYKKTNSQYGYIPSNIQDYINILKKSAIINWKRVLKTQIQSSVKNNHRKSYLRPSRRYSNSKFIFKGKVPDRIAKIIVAIDTSGSIGNEEFNMFMNEIYELHEKYPIELRIIQCDAQIQSDIIYKRNQKIENNIYGRGGTDFRPVFEYIKNNKYRCSNELNNTSSSKYQTYKSKVRNKPNLLIFFTDGYGTYPEVKDYPRYKVLWCIAGNYPLEQIPFGLKVKLEKNLES